ncbi:uncharacterized protein [Fopius arisanus]|uniref:Uncharacterized protein n=1 Tax=Fopius arisanus TaxID=64838 RepID=A0A9R1TLQ7_9HYME|nr:PREDICTED: uncharacterized protein LOC105272590 [Fopius arisanus]
MENNSQLLPPPNKISKKRDRSQASLSTEPSRPLKKAGEIGEKNADTNYEHSQLRTDSPIPGTIEDISEDVDKQLEPFKIHATETAEVYPINTEQLISFLTREYGSDRAIPIALSFTQDIPALSKMLEKVTKHIQEGRLKKRIKRIIKKLGNQEPEPQTEGLSDPEQNSEAGSCKATSATENLQWMSQTDAAMDKLSPPFAPTDPEITTPGQENESREEHIGYTEFNIALKSRKTKSSPGVDGIDYVILKKIPIKYQLILLDLYNEMFSLGAYPKAWNNQFVLFIPKENGKGVRPITLSSCICKLFETITKNRLDWWVEQQNHLGNTQTAFRKGSSCMNNLANLSLSVSQALSTQKHTIAVFLDVQGAFDNVNSDILIEKMAAINCPYSILKFIRFLTYERKVITSTSGEIRHIHKGVPQGRVLSPLLYSIYVSKITERVPAGVKISQFADDTAVYFSSKNLEECRAETQAAIQAIQQNLLQLGLELAPQKTHMLHFNTHKMKPGQTQIYINDHRILSTASCRFLGITIDYKMTFTPQIEKVEKKTHQALNIIKFLRGTWWGSDPATLLILYKNYVRSCLDYGLGIYYPTCQHQAHRLEKIQYQAIRAIMGYRRSTPTNILLGESKLTTVKERAKYLIKNFLIKVMSNKGLQICSSIEDHTTARISIKKRQNRLLLTSIKEIEPMMDQLQREERISLYSHHLQDLMTEIPIDTETGREIKATSITEKWDESWKNIHNSAYCIFTDGRKVEGGKSTGYACVCPQLNIRLSKSINNRASVYTAECMAINEAMNIAIQHQEKKIHIFSDCLSALQALEQVNLNMRTNEYIHEIRKKYKEFHLNAESDHSLKLHWIPSHVGIAGNEEADKLAKEATGSSEPDIIRVPYTDFGETFKKEAYEATVEIIETAGKDKGKGYFANFYKRNKKPWFSKLRKLKREQIVWINRARANHEKSNGKSEEMGPIPDTYQLHPHQPGPESFDSNGRILETM